jgi:Protein of unknown function (DUF3800)
MSNTTNAWLLAYADETHYNEGRYRGIGVITLRDHDAGSLKNEISQILTTSGVEELKWQKLKSARMRFAAQKVLGVVLETACRSVLRADILLWDTFDRRHVVQGRDDIANLQRMYYHLLKNVLRNRWPDNSDWRIFPDEHTGLNWNDVEDFLYRASVTTEIVKPFMTLKGAFKLRLRTEFRVQEILPTKSHQEPLIQVADLLVGLGAYSCEKFETYLQWKEQNAFQSEMFKPLATHKFSCSDRERCRVLDDFHFDCKSRKLGVSLNTFGGLRTPDPANRINFWLYVPQHEDDIAPTHAA